MSTIEVIEAITNDDLVLQGMHYPVSSQKTLVLFIHGMSGNFIENRFAHVLGETLQDSGIGYIYSHNRGYNHINDIRKTDGSFIRCGAMYERFMDGVLDIDAWVKKAQALGYEKIVLVGHSLGSPKVVEYMFQKKPESVVLTVFAAPADMPGLVQANNYQPDFSQLLNAAKELLQAHRPLDLIPGTIWDWFQISAQTFVDLFVDNGPADVLPMYRNPDVWPELASITTPILIISGEMDHDLVIRTAEADAMLIKEKAVGSAQVYIETIPGADHAYYQTEKEFATVVLKYARQV